MTLRELIVTALITTASILSKAQAPASYLDLGTKVSTYPQVEWLNGTPLTKFDSNKVYIVELWATWCVPCIQAMPHLDALYQKFKDKNVVFIAQDVMEHDKAKVEKFLKENKFIKDFNVGYSGPDGSDFDQKWVKAAGVSSIPQTFVIQNNTLVWQTYPTKINEKVLQMLLDGKFTIDAAKAADDGE